MLPTITIPEELLHKDIKSYTYLDLYVSNNMLIQEIEVKYYDRYGDITYEILHIPIANVTT